jgi:hypothetical protein
MDDTTLNQEVCYLLDIEAAAQALLYGLKMQCSTRDQAILFDSLHKKLDQLEKYRQTTFPNTDFDAKRVFDMIITEHVK